LKVTVAKPKKKKVKAASNETNINSSVKTMPMFFFVSYQTIKYFVALHFFHVKIPNLFQLELIKQTF
jgi:hypothetical protein